MPSIIHKLESFEIMGACFEVYKDKGNGFVESVYQECLETELGLRNVPFRAQQELSLTYKRSCAQEQVQAGLHLLRQDCIGDQGGQRVDE